MDDIVMGLIFGFVVGVVGSSLFILFMLRRLRTRHHVELQRYDESLVDLRQERAEDKETNRRLRHELVAKSPQQLVENANHAELERDGAVSERDQAIEQLHLVQHDLSLATGRLADREHKLRQYREALREIRESLEAQGNPRPITNPLPVGIEDDTGEIPAGPATQPRSEPVDLGMVD